MSTAIMQLNRLLVLVGALVVFVGAAIALTASLGILAVGEMPIGYWLREGLALLADESRPGRLIERLVVAGVLVAAFALIYIELRSFAMAARRPIVVREAPTGTISVSRVGLEQLVSHLAMEIEGVMDASARVTGDAELTVRCRTRLAHDTQAAVVSEVVQRAVRSGVERHIGRDVDRVSVHTQFEPLARGADARRRRRAALAWETS